MILRFRVEGVALPQGSHACMRIGRQCVLVDSQDMARKGKDGKRTRPRGQLTAWREKIGLTALNELGGRARFECAVVLGCEFVFARPKGHYTGTGKLSAAGRRSPHPTTTADLSKLVRAIEDALTGGVIVDDSYVVDYLFMSKRWARPDEVPHVVVEVRPAPGVEAQMELAG